jgi:hypothetical protein
MTTSYHTTRCWTCHRTVAWVRTEQGGKKLDTAPRLVWLPGADGRWRKQAGFVGHVCERADVHDPGRADEP